MTNTAYNAAKAATKSLKVSRALHRRLRMAAAKEDRTISEMVAKILNAALAEEQGGESEESDQGTR